MKIYQTLEDRENPDEIEENGPFLCERKNAWLGPGFYFWEYFIKNAHWWGDKAYNGKYVICQATYDDTDKQKIFDLYSNYEHKDLFVKTIEMMKYYGLFIENQTCISRVIDFLISKKLFPYDAIKIDGILSKGNSSSKYNFHVICSSNRPSYVDLIPAVQICFRKKDVLNLKDYKIIFPEKYIQ